MQLQAETERPTFLASMYQEQMNLEDTQTA